MSKLVTPGQLFKIIKTHFFVSGASFLFGFMIFAGIITSDIGKIVYSVITSLIYFISLYSAANEIHQRDKKTYTLEKPYPLKGLVLPFGLLILNVILYLFYLITWKFMTIDGSLFSFQGYMNNILFIMWSFPFNGFINLSNGTMNIQGYILMTLFPFVPTFLGYFAGWKNYDFTTTINNLVYDNKKNQEKNKK